MSVSCCITWFTGGKNEDNLGDGIIHSQDATCSYAVFSVMSFSGCNKWLPIPEHGSKSFNIVQTLYLHEELFKVNKTVCRTYSMRKNGFKKVFIRVCKYSGM